MKGVLVDDNMSNLTSASNEASVSSNNNNRNEIGTANYPQQSFASPNTPGQPAKKKRNLPGNPDPEAEVVALSPRTLLATNRFVCEICNKGFQRDQNLQLHRRGHNLPWKLKQRANKEVRKKVYVCPETTCVHHDPSRALGDLTGIKKHYCRKHGEKKWKCEKCSKRYAVQSDWKAHSKICGTREYRCDCGTLFSRRDSFITHRAFCDALAEESARTVTANSPLLSSQQPGTSSTNHLNLHTQVHSHGGLQPFPLKREQELQQSFNVLRPEMPSWLSGQGPSSNDLSSQLFDSRLDQPIMHQENPNPNPSLPSFLPTPPHSPHMSATALLQKAAQMGVTMSKPCQQETTLRPHQAHMTATGLGSSGLGLSSREEIRTGLVHGSLASYGSKAIITSGCMEQIGSTMEGGGAPPLFHHNTLSPLPSANRFQESAAFEDTFNGMLNPKIDGHFQEGITKKAGPYLTRSGEGGGGRDREGLTRDFLGLRAFPHRDSFINMAGIDHVGSSSNGQQNKNLPSWQN